MLLKKEYVLPEAKVSEWLDHRFLETVIFGVVLALFFGCLIWRMSFGARDNHRSSRRD
jgi:hypothetical protein